MTPEQKEAAVERLRIAREKKGPAQYKNVAKSVIEDILHTFSKNKIEDKTLKIKMNQSMKSGSINSNVKRELMFLYDHTIHHAHIIQIAVSNEFYYLNFKDEFYSPSTIESKNV